MIIKDTDRGYKHLLKQVDLIKRNDPHVLVGVQEDEGLHDSGSGQSVAAIATAHEFGVPDKNLPERSFLRSTLKEKLARLNKLASDLLFDVLMGKKSLKRALGLIGADFSGQVKKKITDLDSPPLAESTKKRKAQKLSGNTRKAAESDLSLGSRAGPKLTRIGSSGNPLIDTGQMRASIRWKVIIGKLFRGS